MAVTVVPDLIELFNGSATTGWNTAPSLSPDAVTPRTGANSVSWGVGIAISHFWRTYTAFNLSNQNVYAWMYSNAPNTFANGGYRIVLGDGTNRRAYFVGGSDRTGFTFNAWSCMMLDTRNLPTNFAQLDGSDAPNLNAITEVGVGYNHLAKSIGGALTTHADIIRYGNGLNIRGGTAGDPGTLEDIAQLDSLTSTTGAYGIIRRLGEGLYSTQGSFTFGDNVGTTSTRFEESNSILFFESNGAGNDTYKIEVVGNSSGTNHFSFGEKLGSGDNAIGINGVTIQSAGPHVDIDLSGENVDVLDIYGSTFNNLGDKDFILQDSVKEFISNILIKSGRVVPNQAIIRNTTFSQTFGFASLLWSESIDIKNSSFIANSIGIQHDTSVGSPYIYDFLTFNGNTVDITNTSGSTIEVNAVNGSNPVTSSGDEVIINNPTTFTVANLQENTEVRLFRTADREEVAGVENSGTTFQYQYNFSGDTNVYLVVHKPGFEYIKIPDITLGSDDQTITVQQRFDRNFLTS